MADAGSLSKDLVDEVIDSFESLNIGDHVEECDAPVVNEEHLPVAAEKPPSAAVNHSVESLDVSNRVEERHTPMAGGGHLSVPEDKPPSEAVNNSNAHSVGLSDLTHSGTFEHTSEKTDPFVVPDSTEDHPPSSPSEDEVGDPELEVAIPENPITRAADVSTGKDCMNENSMPSLENLGSQTSVAEVDEKSNKVNEKLRAEVKATLNGSLDTDMGNAASSSELTALTVEVGENSNKVDEKLSADVTAVLKGSVDIDTGKAASSSEPIAPTVEVGEKSNNVGEKLLNGSLDIDTCKATTSSEPIAPTSEVKLPADNLASAAELPRPSRSARSSRSSSVNSRVGRGASSSGGASTSTARTIVRNAVTSPSLYCGDLHEDVSESALMEIFATVGPIQSVRICRDVVTRRSLGYAYINFFTVRDAERALETLNFHCSPLTKNKPLRVMWKIRDPTMRKSGEGNVFIKGLTDAVDNKVLYDTFAPYGSILSCKVATDSDGHPLGYGFVHFSSAESAAAAIAHADGAFICGSVISVKRFRTKREREAAGQASSRFTNVYIKNLPDSCASEEELRIRFCDFGDITSVHVPVDDEGMPRGFAFLNFADHEAASLAVEEMNGVMLDGSELTVCRAQTRAERDSELARMHEARRRERSAKYQGVNLYVKNLGDDVDDDALRKLFEEFGTVSSSRVMLDEAGYSRCFGFVCFSQAEDATKAVTELNGRLVGTKPIYVALAQHKEARRAQLEAQRAAAERVRSSAMPPSAIYAQPSTSPFIGRAASSTGPYGGEPSGTHSHYSTTAPPRAYDPRSVSQLPVAQGRPPASSMHPQTAVQAPYVPPSRNPAYAPRQPRRNRTRHGAATNVAYPMRGIGLPVAGRVDERSRRAVRDVDLAAARARNLPAASSSAPSLPPKPPAPSMPRPLTIEMLTNATTKEQKQMLGEQLYPKIHKVEPVLAAKITGMLLDIDTTEILHLLDNPDALRDQVRRAIEVLHQHEAAVARKSIAQGQR